jgi:hypothetical protein
MDQFEQVFTQCGDESERRAFIAALYTAATIGHGRSAKCGHDVPSGMISPRRGSTPAHISEDFPAPDTPETTRRPHARLLQVSLHERVHGATVFMGMDSIESGLDFAKVISGAVKSSGVTVVLIGP